MRNSREWSLLKQVSLSTIKGMAYAASMACFAALLTLSAHIQAKELPPILAFYPRCDFTVIDTSNITRNVSKVGAALNHDDLQKQEQRIFNSFRERAQKRGADAVILTERNLRVHSPNGNQSSNFQGARFNTLEYSAQLIERCEEDLQQAQKPTPFNATGAAQKTLSLGSIGGWSGEFILKPANVNERVVTSIEDYSINIQNGAYGLKISASMSEVEQRLGTPTFVGNIDNDHAMLAFGRSLWLVFKDQKLMQVSSSVPYLSVELTNLLGFDDRFDDIPWRISDKFGRYEAVDPDVVKEHSQSTRGNFENNLLSYQNESSQLTIHFSKTDKKLSATEFLLKANAFTLPQFQLNQVDPVLVNTLSAYMLGESDELELDTIRNAPIARARLSQSKSLLWYGGHLFVENLGNSVNTVYLLENPLQKSSTSSAWQFNNIAQYESQERVLNKLGDDVFFMGDSAEVNGANYTQEFIFYDLGDGPVLISSQIKMY